MIMTKRLIDADKLLDTLRKLGRSYAETTYVIERDKHTAMFSVKECIDAVKGAPTIKAEPVVHCKDCKYWSRRNDKPGEATAIGYCHHKNHYIMPLRYDFFCADGAKMGAEVE